MNDLTLPASMQALGAMLQGRREVLSRRLRISFATLEGERFFVDTNRPQVVGSGWLDGADAQVVTNVHTLSELVQGRFDPALPQGCTEHVFMWSGDDRVWAALAKAMSEKVQV